MPDPTTPTLPPEARAALDEAARADHAEEQAAAATDGRVWAVIEIMGHRTRSGAISDGSIGGGTFLRIEHPTALDHDGTGPLVEYYAPSAIFSVKPCSRQAAEAHAAAWWRTEARPALPSATADAYIDVDEDDPDDCATACIEMAHAEAAGVAEAERRGPEPAG